MIALDLAVRVQRIERNRIHRRIILQSTRDGWRKAPRIVRARVLEALARYWTFHPAAIAVERSAGARLAHPERRLPR